MQENLGTTVLTLRETFQMMVLFRVIQYSCFAGCYYTYQNWSMPRLADRALHNKAASRHVLVEAV